MLKYCKLDNENEHFDTSNTSNKQLSPGSIGIIVGGTLFFILLIWLAVYYGYIVPNRRNNK